MQIAIRAVNFVLTHPIRAAVEERLACALAWAGRKTARLAVRLSSVLGPGGQLLTCCCIQVQLPDGRKLVVEDVTADVHVAAERAAFRLDRVLRQLGRRRERKTARRF